MKYFNSNQSLYSKGIFIGCIEGYATFQLENNEIIYFEQINKKIEHHYDLKSTVIKINFLKCITQKSLMI